MKIRVIRLPAQFQECFPAGADKDGRITGASCGIGCCVPRRTRNARAYIKTFVVRAAVRPVIGNHAGHALSYQPALRGICSRRSLRHRDGVTILLVGSGSEPRFFGYFWAFSYIRPNYILRPYCIRNLRLSSTARFADIRDWCQTWVRLGGLERLWLFLHSFADNCHCRRCILACHGKTIK